MDNKRPTPSDVRFLIVGAEKSGTTWLADMLRQHPQIFVPAQKELHYFNRRMDEAPELENYNFTKPVDWYLDFYRPAPPGRMAGEACPAYLWDESAAQRIHNFNADIRILMILRDPAQRFLSAYRYGVQRGSVAPADAQTIYKKYKTLLLERGLYYEQVKRYLDLFPRGQIAVLLYDDLRRDSRAFLLTVEKFLGVSPHLPENVDEDINAAGAARFPFLSRAFASLRRWTRAYQLTWLIEPARRLGWAEWFTRARERNKSRSVPASSMDVSAFDPDWLRRFYADDIARLETLIKMDLRAWKRNGNDSDRQT